MKNKSFLLIIMIAATGALFGSTSSWSDFKKDCELSKNFFVNKFYESLSGISEVELFDVKLNESISKIDSSDVATYSAPAWFIHGIHGYWQRCKRAVKAEQENNIFRNSTIQKYNNFNKFHPIQSLRTGFPKVRNIPVFGPIFTAYATGFVWEVFKDQNKK